MESKETTELMTAVLRLARTVLALESAMRAVVNKVDSEYVDQELRDELQQVRDKFAYFVKHIDDVLGPLDPNVESDE